jgi:AraC-like DNA-binding protein
VAAFVREQRLLRCFDELSRPTKLTRLVSEIATRWGFDNPSHFNRLFNAQFGINPSDVAGAARAGIGHQADHTVDSEHDFQDWSTRA